MSIKNRNTDIDLGLSVACAITPEGFEWTQEDLAEVCGCARAYIYALERNALKKLRGRSLLKPHVSLPPEISCKASLDNIFERDVIDG